MKSSRRGRRPKQPIESEIITIIDLPDTDTTCTVCYAEFLDPEDLKLHMDQVHVTEGASLRRCQFCPSVFCDLEDYCVHIRDTHLSSINCCKYCMRAFTDPDELRKHESKHYYIRNSMYSCSHCVTVFNNISELEEHEYSSHSDSNEGVILKNCLSILSSLINIKAETFLQRRNSTYTCIKCELTTHNPNRYVMHLQKDKCRSYACDNCSNVFSKERNLVHHFQKHLECYHNSNVKEIKCKECHKYVNESLLKQHTKHCKVIKCITCDIVFESMYELAEHQTKEHPLAIALRTCKYCRKEFVGNVTLEKHIKRTHNEELHLYKYLCVYCDEVYKHPKMLFSHFFSKHRDLQPYMCKICDKKFRVRKRFTIHIKLDHKSVGFIEFDDKFHVFFTDKKSEKPFQPSSIVENIDLTSQNEHDSESQNEKESQNSVNEEQNNLLQIKSKTSKIRFKDDENEIELVNVNSDFMNPTETEGHATEVEDQGSGKRKRKRKSRNVGRPRKISKPSSELEYEVMNSVNSDDEPLIVVKKKAKMKRANKLHDLWDRNKRNVVIRNNKKRFTCNICQKYCYTFQNYHHHVSLHFKNEVKKCVKCSQSFKSKSELNRHISTEHSTSKLTETLKTLLERRKQSCIEEQTMTEKFQKTIKRVTIERSDERAIIKEVPNEGLSVQKFIENFTPESIETGKKTIHIETSVSLKPISNPVIRPTMIKMTKYKSVPEDQDIKLTMPVRFKESDGEVQKVNIKLVQKPLAEPKLNLGTELNFRDEVIEDTFDNYNQFVEIDNSFKETPIPEVAQEVMLEGSDEAPKPKQIPHKILIPQLPKEYNEVRIAHLLPEAPYYKIVKVDDILKTQTKKDSMEEEEETEDVKLPDGTKLVNVNPLAHLLGETSVESVLKHQKNKYYKVRTKNFEKAIAKALLQLENPAAVQKKFSRKKNIEVEQ